MENFLIEPPTGLYEKIIKCIRRKQRLLDLKKIIFVSILFVASTIGLFPTTSLLLSDFNQSGFLRFLSLMFSDFSTVTTYWQSFTMVLLETLPAISLALFLAVLLTFLQSIKFLTKDIKYFYEHNQSFRVKII